MPHHAADLLLPTSPTSRRCSGGFWRQQGQRVLLEAKAQEGGRAGLRSMFVMALEAMPYLRRAERTAYGRGAASS